MDRWEERQGKRMGLETRLVSSPWCAFFLFFLDYTNTYLHSEVRLRDPNNGVTIVWSPGIFFTHTLQHGHDNTAMSPHQQPTRKGSNDTRCVVWALCKVFFKYSFIFYLLIGIYRYYIDYNDDIWPKRHVLRHLGPLVSVFFKIIRCFFKTNCNCSEFFECTQTTGPKRRLHHRLGPGIILLHKTTNTTTSTRPRHHTKPPAASSRGCMRA